MFIIKNLILKNDLKSRLELIEQILTNSGYYEKTKQLTKYIYKPEEFARLHREIADEFGMILNEKYTITKRLDNLSGKNLFKKQPTEYSK
ncbi:MAG: hypothetical protein ACLRFE_02435 [Clostridia bacterium]